MDDYGEGRGLDGIFDHDGGGEGVVSQDASPGPWYVLPSAGPGAGGGGQAGGLPAADGYMP